MPDYSRNFLTSMTGYVDLSDPDTEDPPKGALPLYKPKDTVAARSIQLNDKRTINPATGKPYKTIGTKGIKAQESDIKAIISHAKAAGVDPYDALAIALQETNLGLTDKNYGHAINVKLPDNSLVDVNPDEEGAVLLAHMLKEKLNYGKELMKKGVIPEGDEYLYQAYNGYGKLFPSTETVGNKSGQVGLYKNPNTSFYEIPVSRESPLDLKKNPAYGKTVIQLREEVIKKSPEIQKLVQDTAAFKRK